jgi:hypothetical protein
MKLEILVESKSTAVLYSVYTPYSVCFKSVLKRVLSIELLRKIYTAVLISVSDSDRRGQPSVGD